MFILKDNKPRSVYVVEDHISLNLKHQFVECCFHGKNPFKEQAPELVWLFTFFNYAQSSDIHYHMRAITL